MTVENIARNLAELRARGVSVSERRVAHVGEAAKILVRELSEDIPVFENDAFQSAYRDFISSAFAPEDALTRETPAETKDKIKVNIAEDTVNSSILLCSDLCRLMRERGAPIKFPDFFPQSETVSGTRIAYLRSPYSDAALRVFSEVIDNPPISTPRDFAGVCEEVYYGRCRYCILPVETSDEGSLSGFRRLVAKYELCPVLSCSIATANGTQTTRFSLFSKNVERIPRIGKGGRSRGREIFSFRLDAPTDESLNKTMKALHMYGLRVLTVNSTPVAWDEGRYSFEFSAECDNGELDSMLLFLTLEIPEYTPIGLYLQLNGGG